MNFIENFKRNYGRRTAELLKISVPIIIEQVFITMMGMVNIMMAAHLGKSVISAIGMIDAISNLIIALFAALTTGGTIVIAQYIGRKDAEKAKEAAAQALSIGFVFSSIILIFLIIFNDYIIQFLYADADADVIEAANIYMSIINFSYPILAVLQTILGVLRGSGNTRTPMLITIIMNVANVIVGYILIFGMDVWFIHIPSFGVAGAAVSLLLCRAIGLVISLYYLLFISKEIRLNKLAYFKFNFQIQKVVLRLGIPASVESSLFQIGKLITQIFIVGMGTAALAANSVASSVFNIINVPGNAFGMAVMILVGQRIGRGEYDDVVPTTKFALKFSMVLIALLCFICFLLQNVLVQAYNVDAETEIYFKQILYSGVIISPLLWGFSFMIPSALRATGDVRYTMIASISTMWIFRIVLGYVFGIWMNLGVLGIWMAMYVDWLMRGILFYTRLVGKKWIAKSIKLNN